MLLYKALHILYKVKLPKSIQFAFLRFSIFYLRFRNNSIEALFTLTYFCITK